MLPALGLGVEKPAPDIMRAPPRTRSDRLLNWPLLARAYLFLGMMQAAAAISAYWFTLRSGGWRMGDTLAPLDPLYLQATTACLSAIVVMQVVNVFICRSDRRSVFTSGFFGNNLIFTGIIAELVLILLIVYTPWCNAIFGTAPIALTIWLFTLPFAFGMLVVEELRKWYVRNQSNGAAKALSRNL